MQRLVDTLAAETTAETARKSLVALRVVYRLAERDNLRSTIHASASAHPAVTRNARPGS